MRGGLAWLRRKAQSPRRAQRYSASAVYAAIATAMTAQAMRMPSGVGRGIDRSLARQSKRLCLSGAPHISHDERP